MKAVPNIVDLIRSERVDLVVNTPLGKESFFDEKAIRRACIQYGTPCITTLSAAAAAVRAIQALQREQVQVLSMQEYHATEPAFLSSTSQVPVPSSWNVKT